MLPAANRTAGQNLCAPDVCNTPTGTGVSAPIPYVNMGDHAQATGFATTVKYEGGNALTVSTSVSQTSGDEAGTDHPNTRGKGAYSAGNLVRVEQMSAVTLTSSATGNNSNASSGASIVPSTATVRFTLDARDIDLQSGDSPTLEQLRALQRAVEPHHAAVELAELAGGSAVLRIHRFTEDAPTRIFALLSAGDPSRLIIDLRGCPGGDLDAAIRSAADFLPRGTFIAGVVDADGDDLEHRARGEQRFLMPLEIWIDGGTASAAELFAGALQQAGRARLVGERSYGKASSQTLAGHQGALAYRTNARWSLAGGSIEGRGLVPETTTG